MNLAMVWDLTRKLYRALATGRKITFASCMAAFEMYQSPSHLLQQAR